MHYDRIRNTLLIVVALLLIFNLAATLSPSADAVGKAQYKAVAVEQPFGASAAQTTLDAQGAQGWEYVGSYFGASGAVFIFKK